MKTDKNYQKQLTVTAIVGLIASLAMYLGDMLLYFTTQNFVDIETELLLSMGNVSFGRLVAGGLLGPISACLYIVGFYHIYLTIKEPRKGLAKAVFAFLSVSIIVGGAFHAFFPAYGIVANAGHPEIIEQLETYNKAIGLITFSAMALGWIVYCYLILRKKTIYPRLFVLATPMVWIWAVHLFEALPQPYMILIGGGWTNLVMTIFFVASLIALRVKSGVGRGKSEQV